MSARLQHRLRVAACLGGALFLAGAAAGEKAAPRTPARDPTVVAQRTPARSSRTSSPSLADSAAAVGRSIAEQTARLRELRVQISDLRRRDSELGAREKNTAKELRLLQQKAAVNADLLRSLVAMQGRLELQLQGIRAEQDRASEILEERKQRLARTLRAMYERGTPTTAEVVLRTAGLRYALSNFKYMELLARNNERLVREIREQEEYLAATNARLTETLVEAQSNAEETRQEKAELVLSQKAQQSVLRRVRQQRAEYQAALADLAAAEKKVQSVIGELEKRRQAAAASGHAEETFPDVGFARLRGTMPWPVHGRVVTGFGNQKHPKYGTITFNSGIDIAAPEGAPVRVVARGQVEYVKWTDGYGRTIIVNHGAGFYTLYAHLSETLVTEGEAVDPGAVIGRVGDTGSLDGVKLHFEVRDRAEAVDPRSWLGR